MARGSQTALASAKDLLFGPRTGLGPFAGYESKEHQRFVTMNDRDLLHLARSLTPWQPHPVVQHQDEELCREELSNIRLLGQAYAFEAKANPSEVAAKLTLWLACQVREKNFCSVIFFQPGTPVIQETNAKNRGALSSYPKAHFLNFEERNQVYCHTLQEAITYTSRAAESLGERTCWHPPQAVNVERKALLSHLYRRTQAESFP